MAVNPAARFPIYYGNTHVGGPIYRSAQDGGPVYGPGGPVYGPGNPNPSTPGGNTLPPGSVYVPGNPDSTTFTNPGNIFGSGFNGFADPLNLANNYAITPLTPPPAPGFSPGTMPAQNFTNNDFGDFNTPSMQAGANTAHPGILVQPSPSASPVLKVPVIQKPLPPPGGLDVGQSLQVQQSSAAQTVRNSHIAGLNASTISDDYLSSKGGTPLLLSGGTPAFIASLRSRYGQTPNTAISKGGMTVPSSYNTTANPGTPQQDAAPATSNVQLTSPIVKRILPPAQRTLPYRPMIRSGVVR